MDTKQENLLPILAIDTSTQVLSIAIKTDKHEFLFHQNVGAKQSEMILPAIQQLLEDSHLTLNDIETIVYAKGPGTFTGLRIGLGVAQGLSLPHNIKLIGIPTLDAIASLAPLSPFVFTATDARMGELFYAWYNNQTCQCLSPYLVGKAQDISTPIEVDLAQTVGLGNAYSLNLDMPVAGEDKMPTAIDYANLALSKRYPAHETQDAELLYVRDKIALTAKEQAAQKVKK